MERLLEKARAAGLRLTAPRRAVIEVLARIGRPSSVEMIRGELGPDAPDTATVYRTLEALHGLELAHKLDLGEGFARWEPALAPEHHHLVCTGCGRVQCLDFCSAAPMIELARKRHGFAVQSHKIELFGLCAECGAGPTGK